jgi:hypothetical protein
MAKEISSIEPRQAQSPYIYKYYLISRIARQTSLSATTNIGQLRPEQEKPK